MTPDPGGGSGGDGVVLFGGSGFLGPYLLERCPDMISVGRRPPLTANRHIPVESLADLSALNDVDFDRVVYIIGNTDHHAMDRDRLLAGQPTAYDYHVRPLLQTLEQVKHRPLQKFLHFSSVLVYHPEQPSLPVAETAPLDPYRGRYVFSKYLAEEAAVFFGRSVPIITARMANLYGPTPLERFDLVHVVIRQLLADGRAQVWTKRPQRDFIHADDAADAILRLLDTDFTGTVNLGTGTMTSVQELTELLEEISGCPIDDLGRGVPGPQQFRCDISTLRRLTGWEPRHTIATGVRDTYERMMQWWPRSSFQ